MNKTKVRTIDELEVSVASVTGRVSIAAAGTVNTGGWRHPELVDTPHPPQDGNRHFDFVAMAPDGPVPQVIQPIAATRTVQAGAGRFCVIVHAATNEKGPQCIEVQIGDPK
jgi:hypothetical protein